MHCTNSFLLAAMDSRLQFRSDVLGVAVAGDELALEQSDILCFRNWSHSFTITGDSVSWDYGVRVGMVEKACPRRDLGVPVALVS